MMRHAVAGTLGSYGHQRMVFKAGNKVRRLKAPYFDIGQLSWSG